MVTKRVSSRGRRRTQSSQHSPSIFLTVLPVDCGRRPFPHVGRQTGQFPKQVNGYCNLIGKTLSGLRERSLDAVHSHGLPASRQRKRGEKTQPVLVSRWGLRPSVQTMSEHTRGRKQKVDTTDFAYPTLPSTAPYSRTATGVASCSRANDSVLLLKT